MKKKSTILNDKKDHITSKLLGANVDEISVEKFRNNKQTIDYKVNGKLND